MSDIELQALTVVVYSARVGMELFDRDRLRNGYSIGYGETVANGEAELRAELRRRGVLTSETPVA